MIKETIIKLSKKEDLTYQEAETDFEFVNRLDETKEPAITKKADITDVISRTEEKNQIQETTADTKDIKLYENFYKETMSDKIMVEDSKSDLHDVLVENVVKANNEYKDMKNRLKELERMANLQNQMLQQYKENYLTMVDESTRLKKEYDACREETEELKRKYKALVAKVTDINNYTLEVRN